MAPSMTATTPMTNSLPEPTSIGFESTMMTTPAKPIRSPVARRIVIRSRSVARAISTAKNGAELSRTAAIAGPAYIVPTPRPVNDNVVEPTPTITANSQIFGERGSLPPRSGSKGSRIKVAITGRASVMTPAVV